MTSRSDRQSFLGSSSEDVLGAFHVGIVGLGGGGSHIAQQLAHVGIGRYTIIDHDQIDESNLNRLIGGTAIDVGRSAFKTVIAARQIRRVLSKAKVIQIRKPWQSAASSLIDCDSIVGCLDSFAGRLELEALSRRYLIPYLDLGMDVYERGSRFGISGQVTLSLPGRPCLKCMGVIREEWRAIEAANYGQAGGRPQVVWPNGLLASIAVGILVQLVTPWHDDAPTPLLEYDGNSNTVTVSTMLQYLTTTCPHYASMDNVGDPWFQLGRTG
jgi:hypothetical protein